MIIVEDTLISEEIFENNFVCDLNACKGACCIEGDRGAPITRDEVRTIEKNLDSIKEELPQRNKELIENIGFYEKDDDGELVTTCLPDGTCAFAITDKAGILKCGIEESFNKGDSDFLKPVSCHLYPARIKDYGQYTAINYHRWHICDAACSNGDKLNVPVYEFLETALRRRFGDQWYDELCKVALAYRGK